MQQRLFQILNFLLTHPFCTAKQLSSHFEVSQRTIYRDIDALSGSGVPIYTERGKGGGIRLLPGYSLEKTFLDKDEQTQLLASLQSLQALGVNNLETVSSKLSALFGKQKNWLTVDFSSWGSNENLNILFEEIKNCILQNQIISFAYSSSNSNISTRFVEPYTIFLKSYNWYLHGYCLEKQDFRFFKLTRIRNFTNTYKTFSSRSVPSAISSTTSLHNDTIFVKLQFDDFSIHRVYDEFSENELFLLPTGGCIVQCHMPSGQWLIDYILSFGQHIVVLEPLSLRNSIQDSLKNTLSLYL